MRMSIRDSFYLHVAFAAFIVALRIISAVNPKRRLGIGICNFRQQCKKETYRNINWQHGVNGLKIIGLSVPKQVDTCCES